METVQVFLIIILVMAEHCCTSAEPLHCAPIFIHSNDNGICPLEIMRENARQLLKNVVSAKLSNISSSLTTEPPTDDTTSTDIPTTYYSTTAPTTTVTPRVLLQSDLFGGPGGDFFDDIEHNDNIVGIVGMRIQAGGQAVNSIQVTYRLRDGSNYTAPMHGQTGGTEYSFTLADGEKLTRMEGEFNQGISTGVIDSLTFYSNMNNVYGPYGTIDQIQFSFTATEFVAFFGRAGRLIDAIGVYYIN